jgi:hypothetical protein
MTVSKLIRVAATASGLLAFGPPPAQIFFNDRVVIEFARGKMPAEMSWTTDGTDRAGWRRCSTGAEDVP